MKRILIAVAAVAGLFVAFGSQAEAGWGYPRYGGSYYGRSLYGYGGYSHGRGYYGYYGRGYGYGGYGRGSYSGYQPRGYYGYQPGCWNY